MFDVVFYEAFKEEEALLGHFLPQEIKAKFSAKTIQEEGDEACPGKIVSVRTQSVIPKEWAREVSAIFTRSAGYEHLAEYKKATKTNVALGYLPDYCARAVAEQAVLMMLFLLRKTKLQIKNFDKFKRDGVTGLECKGRNLLVVGVGRIGSQIVEIGYGLGMNVKGVDIDPKLKDLEHVSLCEGMPWADVVISAVSLTQATKGMFDYGCFKQAKKGIVFVNISRGEVSPTEDLKKLLDEEFLLGLGLDVFEDEKKIADSIRNNKEQDATIQAILELKGRDNVFFTPHNAFNTKKAVERKAEQSVAAVTMFLKNNQFPEPIPQG